MKKKYRVAVAIAALAVVLTAGCGAKGAESVALATGSTTAAMSSADESAASDVALKGESAADESEKKLANFKAENLKAGDDITTQAEAAAQMLAEKHEKLTVTNGTYQVNVTFSDDSGKAKIASPTGLTVKDGRATVKIVWSSDKYDYMEVEDIHSIPEIQDGHSVFMVSVMEPDKSLAVVGDTTTMSTPHAVDYQLTLELQK